ncbi:MAG: biotin/lipoyl-containing protein, partial [Candidatus Poribacteria bacterium]
MATTIVMPQLASTMESGTIVKWLKKVGEEVTEGEAIIEITTDKVDVEVESPASGVLLKIIANEGEEVPVKKPVGIIGNADEVISEISEKQEIVEEKTIISEQKPAMRPVGRIFASPRAKRLAKETGINIADVIGTGPNGRIVGRDILKFVQEGKKPSAGAKLVPGEIVKFSPIQKTVAERLSMSYRTAPHIDLVIDVNCEKMISLRTFLRAQGCNA